MAVGNEACLLLLLLHAPHISEPPSYPTSPSRLALDPHWFSFNGGIVPLDSLLS
jgi:hypothetical protein